MSAFRRDEDGGLIIFSLFTMIIMLIVGGVAVDLMRFETRRTALQNTLDSAVLSATNLSQSSDPETLVKAYFEVTGYDPSTVDVQEVTNLVGGAELVGRQVSASTRLTTNTFFMHMLGIDTLSAPAASSAVENIQNAEISLVLDISGSMRWDEYGSTPGSLSGENRINDLKDAVVEFIDSVMQVDCSGGSCIQSPNTRSTTINIIPYAGHVNPGPDLFEIMGGERWHGWSSCMEVTDDDFDHARLPGDSADQLPHFMKWSIDRDWMNWGWCPTDDAGIMVAENDAEAMKDFVRNLKLHDGTATHVGMKYGLALLDPSSRDEFRALNARGIVEDDYKNRPADFEDDQVVKYIVLMTDGKITDQFRPEDDDEGDSMYVNYDDIYSASGLHADNEDSWSDTYRQIIDRFGTLNSEGDANDADHVEQDYVGGEKYSEGGRTHNRNRNVDNFLAACNEAKRPVNITTEGGQTLELRDDRVMVFTIAFLAPTGAKEQMRDCASSPQHYYEIDDLSVGHAFKAIARTINQLRLNQ